MCFLGPWDFLALSHPPSLMPVHALHSCHQKCGRKSSLHFPGDLFAAPERAGDGPTQGPLPYLDDDIPLLHVEDEPGERELVGLTGAGLHREVQR